MTTAYRFPPGPTVARNPIKQLLFVWQMQRDLMGAFSRWQQQYGDIYCIHGENFHQYLLSNPDAIHEMLVTKAAQFGKSPDYTHPQKGLARFLGSGLLTSDGNFWKRQRRLAAPAFHVKRIESYADTMVRYAQAMLENWHDGALLDISQEMTRLTMLIVGKTLFNADVAGDVEHTGQAMEVLQRYAGGANMQLLPTWLPTPMERRVRRAVRDLDTIVYRLIHERRASGEDRGDLLSMLLLAEDENGERMTDKQARDEAVTIYLAGHETTANALKWTWMLLAQNPDVEAKLHAELDAVLGGRAPTLADLERLPYTEMVIKESLRLYPPAWGFGRIAIEGTELGGYSVPKGTLVSVLTYHMHHDPKWWPEPERFMPERFSPENEAQHHKHAYLPFGGGPRICIGNNFAMMEARLILATVASRYRLRLSPGQTVEMQPLITLNPKGGLPMTLETRLPQVTTPTDTREAEPA